MPACLLFDFSSHWWQKKQSERMGDTARVPWSTWRLRGNEPLPHMQWWKHWPFIPCPLFSVHPSQAERKKKFNKRWKLICIEWTGTGRRRNRSWEKEMESCVDLGFFFTFSILFKWINEVRLVIYLRDALVGERDIVILESIWLDLSLISIESVINI